MCLPWPQLSANYSPACGHNDLVIYREAQVSILCIEQYVLYKLTPCILITLTQPGVTFAFISSNIATKLLSRQQFTSEKVWLTSAYVSMLNFRRSSWIHENASSIGAQGGLLDSG